MDNTTGSFNTANGWVALGDNTTGSGNTATGAEALSNNITGSDNTVTGASALMTNTTGFSNTATGVMALFHNTTGNVNTATGLNRSVIIPTARTILQMVTGRFLPVLLATATLPAASLHSRQTPAEVSTQP